MKLQFFPIDINYKIEDNRIVTYIIGKNADNKRICLVDDLYLPYFYAIGEKIDILANEIKSIRIEENNNIYFVIKTELVERELLGKKISALKVYVNRPKAIKQIAKELSPEFKVYEHDILFERRYLIDNKITLFTLHEAEGESYRARIKADIILKYKEIKNISNENLKPRIMAVDIETLYKTEEKNNPVIIISFYTNDYKKTITYANVQREDTEKVRGEAELLLRFKEEIEEFRPDILVGYNSDSSLGYIKKRADKYKIDMDLGADLSSIKLSKKGRTRIFGIVHIDLYNFIKNILAESLEAEDYDLEYISYELLGEDVEYTREELANVLKDEEGLKKYIRDVEYDAKLIYSLTLKILPNIFELTKLVNIGVYDISRINISQLVESFIIKYTRELNQIALNRPTAEEAEKRSKFSYEGSFVLKPTPGIYKNIAVMDFRSLYPSIILTHNISFETLNQECKVKEKVPGKDYWFCKERKGIIPLILEDLITRRRRIEETMDKSDVFLRARSYSLKLLANSFYGYFAFTGARWYSIECAESITAYGRYYINTLVEEASKQRFKVIYGDTDSIFILTRNKEQAMKFIENFNKKMPANLDLEFENFYSAGIFVSLKEAEEGATKRYALLGEEGKLKIKGFESVRKNIPKIVKEVQKNVLRDVLEEKDRDEIVKYVKRIIQDINENKAPIEKMILQTQLQKPLEDYEHKTPYVVIAKIMQQKGYKIGQGSTVKYVVTKGSEIISKRVKLPEETKQSEYAPDYYINNQIIPALESIFKVLDISKEELLKGKDQSKLDSYIK